MIQSKGWINEQSVLLTRSNVIAVSENGEHSCYIVVERPECRCCCWYNNDLNLTREYAGISVGDGNPRSLKTKSQV